MGQKHVLFFTFHLPRPTEAGAARPWEELQLLLELGYRVTVVTSATHYLTGTIEKAVHGLWRSDSEEEFRIIRTWAPRRYRTSSLRRLVCYLAYSGIAPLAGLCVRGVDVVLSGTDPPFMTPGALFAAWSHGAKLVLDERDMYPETLVWLGVRLPRPVFWAFSAWARFLSRRATAILTVSPGFVRLLKKRGVPPERITLVLNYFPRELPQSKPGSSEHDSFHVLYAGGLGQATELSWMLEAAKILSARGDRNMRFTIAGEGERRSEYEEYCERNGLGNVSFLGPRPRREMDAVYRDADVAIHCLGSQWRNSLSSKIFEYMGNGLPVIFAGEGDIADVLLDSGAGMVVPPGEPCALAEALRELEKSPAARDEMSKHALEYIRRRFDREAVREEFAHALAS